MFVGVVSPHELVRYIPLLGGSSQLVCGMRAELLHQVKRALTLLS